MEQPAAESITPARNNESLLRFVLDVSRTCAELLDSRACAVEMETHLVGDKSELLPRGTKRSFRVEQRGLVAERATVALTHTRIASSDSVRDRAEGAGAALRANCDRSAETSFAFCERKVGPCCQSVRSTFPTFSLSPAALGDTTKPPR